MRKYGIRCFVACSALIWYNLSFTISILINIQLCYNVLWLLGPNRLFLKLQWIKALILTIKMTLKIGFGILELNGLIWGGWCTIDSFSLKYVRKFELPERNQVFPQNASIAIQGAFVYNFKVQTMPNILEEFLKNSAVVFKTPTR